MENRSASAVAQQLGYSVSTVYSLIRDLKAGKLKLFPDVFKGPIERRTPLEMRERIINYRKENLSAKNISQRLLGEGFTISERTVERVLTDAGFQKITRRTNLERGISYRNKIIPVRSKVLDLDRLKPFKVDCPVAGVFFFIPYIIESGVMDIVQKCALPNSNDINSTQASLSMLLLKLIGNERLSHMDAYDHEPGFGVFADLNVLPKSTYMCTYSCLTSESMLLEFQSQLISHFQNVYPNLYGSDFINIDFHSILHCGDKSQMEKVWCGSRNKRLKGANTIFAQDADSNVILYTRADILRKNQAKAIKDFVSYWKTLKGQVNETLVFDCRLTKYEVLDELDGLDTKFITLRKRSKNLIENTYKIPDQDWSKVKLSIPKRKYNRFLVHESEVMLRSCSKPFRQIIIKDHGRQNPTYIITNNWDLLLEKVLEVYAKRWHIEKKLAELVSFFNLNALSSPLMIRIHFDILWTVIADTLYHRFAQDLPRFEKEQAPTIFRRFVNMPGQVEYDGKRFIIKIRKRAHTPILMGVPKLQRPFTVPWLNNRSIEIIWSP
ncbi:transposase [Candidatus Pacearchaeota archaeon]|nr:transposase [Candidatus Pacearchaeota archaeon]